MPQIHRHFIIGFIILFGCLTAIGSHAAVTSTGEINVQGDDQGRVPASSTVTLIATVVVDRSLAEPGEEVKTFEILLPAGFIVRAENFRSITRDGRQLNATAEVLGNSIQVILDQIIDDFSNSRYDITFDSRTPNVTANQVTFRVRIRNPNDRTIGEFIKPGQADGKPNNDDFTLQVIPNVPPAAVLGFTLETDPTGENDVTVKWQKSDDPDVSGYFIYRDNDPPINVDNPAATVFRDINVLPGNHNYAIEAYKTPLLRSKRSNVIPVVVKPDTAPPQPPQRFVVIGSGDAITLMWNNSPSRDVEKYRLFFGTFGTQPKLIDKGEIPIEANRAEYEFTDRRILKVGIFVYTIEAIDEAGNSSEQLTDTLRILGEPTPNPFTPLSSNSEFNRVIFPARAIEDAEGEFIVSIFDINGALVKELRADPGASELEWNGKDENGEVVESGVYVYQMRVGESFRTGTLIVAK